MLERPETTTRREAHGAEPAIVFIHRGESWYLYYTVKQARKWNPAAPIFVVSDVRQRALERYATVVPLQEHMAAANAFAHDYTHHSANPAAFELFCFQRWFILRSLMEAKALRRVVHLDSDVLCFTDFVGEFARLGDFDVGIVGFQGPQSMLISSPHFVKGLCERIVRLFTEERAALAELFEKWRQNSPDTAVSDMHALHTFLAGSGLRSVDLSVVRDGAVYDDVIHESGGCEMSDGIKKIEWRGNEPWVRQSRGGDAVRLKTIHCQGPSKGRIVDLFRARDFAYYTDRLFSRLGLR